VQSSKNGLLCVCGFVNARNSYGGYTGFYPFMAVVDAGHVTELGIANSRAEATVILSYCEGEPVH
jgi:hypothetical protein